MVYVEYFRIKLDTSVAKNETTDRFLCFKLIKGKFVTQ